LKKRVEVGGLGGLLFGHGTYDPAQTLSSAERDGADDFVVSIGFGTRLSL